MLIGEGGGCMGTGVLIDFASSLETLSSKCSGAENCVQTRQIFDL